jgi:hypothetical protein
MQHSQPSTLAELVAQSVPDMPDTAQMLDIDNMPATLADLIAQSQPDVASDLVLRDYPYQPAPMARMGFTEQRIREGKCVLGWFWEISE